MKLNLPSSRQNKVVNDSFEFEELNSEMKTYIQNKSKKFKEHYPTESAMDNIKSWFAEKLSGALGHGAVVTFPDRPFLKWKFKYEETGQICELRDNPATFLEACEKLHIMFKKVADHRTEFADPVAFKDFPSIQDQVSQVLNTQAKQDGRIQAWQDAAQSGDLFGTGSEVIPQYDEDTWHNQRDNLKRKKDSNNATEMDIYYFYQAAAIHRVNVLRNLLPSHELVVA